MKSQGLVRSGVVLGVVIGAAASLWAGGCLGKRESAVPLPQASVPLESSVEAAKSTPSEAPAASSKAPSVTTVPSEVPSSKGSSLICLVDSPYSYLLSFFECRDHPRFLTFPDCYSYTFIEEDGSLDVCIPGRLQLEVSGPDCVDLLLVDTAIVRNIDEHQVEISVKLVKILASREGYKGKQGGLLATLIVEDGKPKLMRFGPELRPKTGSKTAVPKIRSQD